LNSCWKPNTVVNFQYYTNRRAQERNVVLFEWKIDVQTCAMTAASYDHLSGNVKTKSQIGYLGA